MKNWQLILIKYLCVLLVLGGFTVLILNVADEHSLPLTITAIVSFAAIAISVLTM